MPIYQYVHNFQQDLVEDHPEIDWVGNWYVPDLFSSMYAYNGAATSSMQHMLLTVMLV